MFILVYGAKGWIGGQFMELLKTSNVQYVSGTARVDDEDALRNEIEKSIQVMWFLSLGEHMGK